MVKTLVIIPAFNEQDSIETLIKNVKQYKYDYIVINDCSNDETGAILDKKKYSHLDLPINLGIAGVTRVGFKYAKANNYDCAICIDGDGQHPPKYISNLIEEIKKGNDYVVGSRYVKFKKPFSFRMIGSRILCALIGIKTGKKVYDPTSGMRALGKKVINLFDESMNFYAEPDAMCYLIKKGYKVKEVQVDMNERETGESYFSNPLKSIYYMICEIISILFIQ